MNVCKCVWKRQFRWLTSLRKRLKCKTKKKIIKNYFKTSYPRNVLISYIIYPFQKGMTYAHTNSREVLEIAKIFRDCHYNVYIVDYDYEGDIDYAKYDVIFGFGDPMVNSFYRREGSLTTIYYGTGMHVFSQNHATLKRVEEVFKKTGVWMPESGRIVAKAWSIQTTLVDNIITLGNDQVIQSYRQFFDRRIYSVPVTCYKIFDYQEILAKKLFTEAKKHFLWFGSMGFIHKGLDLLLEVFKELPDIHLHICGQINKEQQFVKYYHKELYDTPNIHTYGYVDIQSLLFKELIIKCGFVIFPSCAEGEPSSVMNVMCYGLVPVVTSTAGIRIKNFGLEIKQLNRQSIIDSIKKAQNFSADDLGARSLACAEDVTANHSIEKFGKELEKALKEILKNKQEK